MKTYAVILACLLTAACVKKNTPGPDDESTRIENLLTTQEFAVTSIPEGMYAQVTDAASGNTIAVLSAPATILLARSTTPSVSYVKAVDYNENVPIDATQLWQVIAFEDSRNGDYDYNDLVIHVKYQTNSLPGRYGENQGDRSLAIGIQPIALGSLKKIALGCDIYQGQKLIKGGIIIADDCREKFFGGASGMINTYSNVQKEFCRFDYLPYYGSNLLYYQSANPDPLYVNWFIDVDGGTRLYAVSSQRSNQMLDPQQRPYGIVFSETGYSYYQGNQRVGKDWFNYPVESTPIDQVYPKFGAWLKGECSTESFKQMYDPSAEGCFDAIGKKVYEIDLNQTDALKKPSQQSHVIPMMRTQADIDQMNW